MIDFTYMNINKNNSKCEFIINLNYFLMIKDDIIIDKISVV